MSDRTGSKWQSWGLNSQSLASDHSASQPLSQPRQSPEPATNWTEELCAFSLTHHHLLRDVGFSDSHLTNGNTGQTGSRAMKPGGPGRWGQASFNSLSTRSTHQHLHPAWHEVALWRTRSKMRCSWGLMSCCLGRQREREASERGGHEGPCGSI